MKTTIYVARHGETRWNKEQRFQGQLDSDLTPLGKYQSTLIARRLVDKSISLIMSSTLGRAVDTATICKDILGVDAKKEPTLIERHFGDWQGHDLMSLKRQKHYDEILHKITDIAPVGGESAVKCGERIYQSMVKIAKGSPNKNLLVIFHGEALRCFLLLLGEYISGNAYHLFENGYLGELVYQQVTNPSDNHGKFTYRVLTSTS